MNRNLGTFLSANMRLMNTMKKLGFECEFNGSDVRRAYILRWQARYELWIVI